MAAAEPMVEDQEEKQDFKLELAHKRFLYKTPDVPNVDKAKLKQEILDAIYAEDLAPTYQQVCDELGWPVDSQRLAEMQAKNQQKLAELDARATDAAENLGDIEVRDALQAKADYLCKLGDREAAREAYAVTAAKTAGAGPKLDLVFSMLRADIAASDWHAVKRGCAQARQLCDEGGDWERKNRLKVYEAVFYLATRDFKQAAQLFLDSTATFTTTELFPYQRCIFYTVVTSVITLDRVALKTKVVDAPEILTVVDQLPPLAPFLNSLYYCNYSAFFRAFAEVLEQIRADPYMHPHLRYYMREMRVVAYSQFLESYKSVTLDSMARAFGVGPAFLDRELADFIVAGRLPAKIDKVAGIIETNRPDAKNAQYQQTIKHGDILLNRLQRLSKVVDTE